MRRSRLEVVLAASLALLTSACADGAERTAPTAKAAAAHLTVGCAHTSSGFALSLALDTGGQPTPVAAAVFFGAHGGVPGYRFAAGSWETVPNAAGSAAPPEGVTLRAGDVSVHVVQLRDATWAVDSGSHCISGS